jgi:UDP-N-acetyl-D-glucosamine dehydrogenase
MSLKDKIDTKAALVGVIGLGYVGLPLAVQFCQAGYRVVGFDIDEQKVEKLLNGESYVLDVPSGDVAEARKRGLFCATTDFNGLNRMDVVSICVPTPLRKSKEPDLSYIRAAVDSLKPRLHKQMLIVLESTTYPGTTEELLKNEIEILGFRVGADIFLCFSPERVDPGNAAFRTANTPKVIGGVTERCSDMGALLYSRVMDTVVKVSSANTAEMVKLLENTFRAVNIGLINEMALMCERMGIDIWEVISAAATKPFGFMPFYPGPGIGGHCIPLDPMYLSWKAKSFNFYNRFIELASDINGNMPYHVVTRVSEVLNLEGKALSSSRIFCLGLAYKRDVDDYRESPGLDIINLLQQHGADVVYNDPYIVDFNEKGFPAPYVVLTPDTLKQADCILLLTDHKAFDYHLIARYARLIFDTRNAFKGIDSPNIFRLGGIVPATGNRSKRKTPRADFAAVKE